MKNRYWEDEEPIEVDTGPSILRFFRNAGRLQISVKYVDADGITKRGRSVTLNVERIRRNPAAINIFRQIATV